MELRGDDAWCLPSLVDRRVVNSSGGCKATVDGLWCCYVSLGWALEAGGSVDRHGYVVWDVWGEKIVWRSRVWIQATSTLRLNDCLSFAFYVIENVDGVGTCVNSCVNSSFIYAEWYFEPGFIAPAFERKLKSSMLFTHNLMGFKIDRYPCGIPASHRYPSY